MYIKGFDKNLCCRGEQFEIGGEYKKDNNGRPLGLCTATVYHFCDSIRKVHRYYSCAEDNRFCEIEILGEIVSDGEKCGSDYIRVVREIVGEELNIMFGKVNGNTGLFNSGDRNSGNRNSGDRNSGNRNSGNRNSGTFNSCNFSSGVFCSVDPKIKMFNVDTDMTAREFYNSRYYEAICSAPFDLTEWVSDESLPTGGKLVAIGYKEACAKWWSKMTVKNRKTIMSMPNFDAAVFEEITGIKTA